MYALALLEDARCMAQAPWKRSVECECTLDEWFMRKLQAAIPEA